MAKRKRTDAELRVDYIEVFGTPAGQRVLGDMLKFAQVGNPSHVKGDPYETAYREGRKAAVERAIFLLGGRSDPTWQERITKEWSELNSRLLTDEEMADAERARRA